MIKKLIAEKGTLIFIEAHNPLSALIASKAEQTNSEGRIVKFDGIWSSSLTDSASRGIPDNETLALSSRLENIADIRNVTDMPIIMDADTGGQPEHFSYYVKRMINNGVNGVIIEDKTGLKKNSLFGTEVEQTLADINDFSEKIKRGKSAVYIDDFMIIARLESLIAGFDVDHALERADAYVEAGADGIMIHSCKKTPDEVFLFSTKFRKKYPSVPLICVPTTYSATSNRELSEAGFNVIIYANHMLRAAYKAMENVSKEILRYGRTAEVENSCMSVKEIISLIP
ncbi:phosphoenolpyruvate mutase (plasmid) [Pantoea allii]|uniref:phosphoenolpyruvate mutase n=1 Tax=Pantoea TaxID=53335 RepID=UPI001F4E72AD|nr:MULTISPECIES: phosphoenolpyruvate mutase [Pantoea]MCH9299063.1 phosphoenolpyruvate mutase [Pantoea allii]